MNIIIVISDNATISEKAKLMLQYVYRVVMNTEFSVIKLEKHDTKDIFDKHVNGSLTVVWRDWDSGFKLEPKMIYVSSVNSGEIKGPHIHKKRTSFFTCVHGKVVFILRDENGKFHEIEANAETPKMIKIPRGIASAHVNISNQTSRVLALADISWKPNDNEMENVVFSEYDWRKWFISQ